MLIQKCKTLGVVIGLYTVTASCAMAQTFSIEDAADYGNSHRNYPPANAIDGNIAYSSRWAATFAGGSANLYVDLGTVRKIDDVGIAWGGGDRKSFDFEVRARAGTSGAWTKVFSGSSSGSTEAIERYNVDDINARQVRVKVFSNSAGSDWADITEFEVYGTSGPDDTANPPGNSSISIPGRIEAEDFVDYSDNDANNKGGSYRDTGVDIQACSDSGCGYNVGWMSPGEWLEYEIDVKDSKTYEASLRVASRQSNAQIALTIDGRQIGDNLSVGNTGGWQSWQTRKLTLGDIEAGEHTLRLSVKAGALNLNWIEIDDKGSAEPPTIILRRENFGLDPNAKPWENFDLTKWSLDTPAPRDNDACKAERTWDYQWSDQNPLNASSRPYFFTHSDGGMRFVTDVTGQTTSNGCNSGYPRSELREMLRAGNRNTDDTGVSKNNWKLGYQPGNDNDWGGVNGVLKTTLRVNQVSTTGSSSQVGRVIIGQIHAGNDEPLRLYYRKRAGQAKGCIYFAHEIRDDDDVNFPMIGDLSCTSAPSNGIALNELFSYSITNDNEDITVVIRRGDEDGGVIARTTIDMNELDSGYDRSDEWMYFKAGAYTQNNTGDRGDGDIVTIYRLSASHD